MTNAPDDDVLDVAPSTSRTGRRRGLVVGATAAAVALIGGGVAYGVGQLSGGGAQPDERIPASAMAVLSVDLDPSAGQKVDALRFARKFPELRSRIGSGDDLRKVVFDAISDSSDVSASWKDVEPWLGDRAAVAVVPAADELDDPVPLVVLAVTDEAKATSSLPTVLKDASCEVADGFAVCAQDADVVKKAVTDAASKSLADESAYAKDVDRLGDRGIVSAWVDLGRIKDAAPDLLSGVGGLAGSVASASSGQLKGRYVAAVRFDGPHLELAGRVTGAELPSLHGSADAGSLPENTLAALAIGDAGRAVQAAWDRLHDAAAGLGGAEQLDQEIANLADTYGVTLPDDLVAAVGDRLTLAVGPSSTPQVAARLTGSGESVDRLVAALEQASGTSLATSKADGATVIASDEAYAEAVAKGDGLGSSDRFKDAVPDQDSAQAVLFVDIAGLVTSYADQLGVGATTRDQVAPLAALGVSAHQDGDTLDYRVRLTTR